MCGGVRTQIDNICVFNLLFCARASSDIAWVGSSPFLDNECALRVVVYSLQANDHPLRTYNNLHFTLVKRYHHICATLLRPIKFCLFVLGITIRHACAVNYLKEKNCYDNKDVMFNSKNHIHPPSRQKHYS